MMIRRAIVGLFVVSAFVGLSVASTGSAKATPVSAPGETWTNQIGTRGQDHARDVATDSSGNIYVVGEVNGYLDGQEYLGDLDSFLRKLDPAGNEIWTRMIATVYQEHSRDVAVDAGGRIYIVGATKGNLGISNFGNFDGYLRVFNSQGDVRYTRQFRSTTGGGVPPADAWAEAVVVDSTGNAYVAGYTENGFLGEVPTNGDDPYLRKFGPAGERLWVVQFQTGRLDRAVGLAIDSSNHLYVASEYELRKYTADGVMVWRKFFPEGIVAEGLTGDSSGNVFISGHKTTSEGTWTEAFVSKYNSSGAIVWSSEFDSSGSIPGGSTEVTALDISVDASGNVYVIGSTEGVFSGQTDRGGRDAYLRKYSSTGSEIWTRQFGTDGIDSAYGLHAAPNGGVFVVGSTDGEFPGYLNKGWNDGFLRKYDSNGNTSGDGPAQPPGGTGDIVVYDDSMHWQNWSWSTSVNPHNSSAAFEGATSMMVTYNSAWAGLSMHTSESFPADEFSHLHFALHGDGNPIPRLRAGLYDQNGQLIKDLIVGSYLVAEENGWYVANIPVTTLGASGRGISRLMIQEYAGASNVRYLIDDLRFVGFSNAPPPPPPPPAPPADTAVPHFIFADSLFWDNWSWNASVSTHYPPAYLGAKSMVFIYHERWGGVQVHTSGRGGAGKSDRGDKWNRCLNVA